MSVPPSQIESAEFDYIVVGSGAGGGPLAARLALAGRRVLVIEAGGNAAAPTAGPEREVSLVPSLHGVSTEHPELSWEYFVKHYDTPPTGQDPKWHTPKVPDPAKEGIFYPRAAGIGGYTIHNAMITIAGSDSDWDDLADLLADESWRGARMRHYFQRMERNEYSPLPTSAATSVWRRAWDNINWLFGKDPDHTRGGHGFKGWLHTSVVDLSLGLTDKQLLKMLKAALVQSQLSGLERASTLVSTFLKGKIGQALDPNHARTKAESPEGLALIPLSVCGKRTTVTQNLTTPNVQRGRRSSPREFLLEVQTSNPQNLTIWTDCLVTKVLLSNGPSPRAIGVEYQKGKKLYRAHPQPGTAAGEVKTQFVREGGEIILSGGSFNTPQLLMLSGIGDREQLAQHRIPCRIHSPGVGRNLQDRYEVTVISQMNHEFSLLSGATFRPADTTNGGDPHLREWRDDGTGLYSSNGSVLGIFKRSLPELQQPDLFIFGIPLPFEGYKVGYSNVGSDHTHFTWTILKAHTQNHDGTVKLRSADPLDTPEINFHYFNEVSSNGQTNNDPDLAAIVHGVKFVRGIGEHAKLVVKGESHPGTSVTDDEQSIKDWIRRVAWGHHACGTCRMGRPNDADAVLDSRFRVLGEPDDCGTRQPIGGLRVVDASIFPRIPGYFIVTNIYVASEKAADVILEAYRPPTHVVAAPVQEIPKYPTELQLQEAAAIRKRREQVPVDCGTVAANRAHESGSRQVPIPDQFTGGDWPDDVTGLGISGGGIRSATLSLGILQAMAKHHWLRRMDFMATVSGGGYIGSFLGRFYDRLRHVPTMGPNDEPAKNGPTTVEQELADPDSRMIAWLRMHGNYIAPSGKGDARLNVATYVRNFLSVHFVVGLLLFALFGVANALRYGLFDPLTAGLGFVRLSMGDMPLGHLLDSLLGAFASPWFMLSELLLLFLVLPRIIGYWIVSQDKHERFHSVSLSLLFVVGSTLLALGVVSGLAPEPLILGLAVFSAFIPVELAWRRGREAQAALGSGGVEAQRLRTRNYLTYDLGLMLTLVGATIVFALIDTVGHGLQQWLIEKSKSYATAFAAIGAGLTALMPVMRTVAGFFAGGDQSAAPPSSLTRMFKKQIMAALLSVVMFSLPLVAYSFAAHAVYEGGSAIRNGLAVTAFALLLSLILRHPKGLTFVNRSSLAQVYAARLGRAYLGASNPLRQRPEGANITEVIAGDDIPSIRDYQPHAAGGPFHLLSVVVNQTVDFTSQRGNRDRLGENMAVSCLGVSIGNRWHSVWKDSPLFDPECSAAKRPTRLEPVGYKPGDDHPLIDESGQPTNRAEMLSLRQWMALSGAAIGPGAGQATQLGTALLMGIANLRTGYWWDSGIAEVSRDGFPKLTFLRRLLYLIPEFFQTQSLLLFEWVARFPGPWEQYWNLSDGGLFENTSGYELIRRRIPRIIICDGSADATYQFEAFGELTRKARIDFDASITPFTAAEIAKLVPKSLQDFIGHVAELQPERSAAGTPNGPSKKHATLYWVDYQTGPRRRSVILHLKATLTGDESGDVQNYFATHPDFPHESTGDQVFEEPQWESYRKLGQHIASPLFEDQSWFWAIPLTPSDQDPCC